MRKIGNLFCYGFVFLVFYSCAPNKPTSQVEVKTLDYPSASAIEYYDGKLYIIGDDATNLLITDSDLRIIDSPAIVLHPGSRIPKDTKPDLEAAAIYSDNNEPTLLLLGSGSLDPYRNAGWKYHLRSRIKENIYLQPLYSKIKQAGIKEINIEGACYGKGKLLLANRGSKSYPYNQLIIVDEEFLRNDGNYRVSFILFEIQKDTALFKGISGLTYARQTDQLLLTISTEDTRNSYEDGAIGKSYVWIINDISGKLNTQFLKADKIIDLEGIDSRFKGQKIESATIIDESKDHFELALLADNDDGRSTIFKLVIEKD